MRNNIKNMDLKIGFFALKEDDIEYNLQFAIENKFNCLEFRPSSYKLSLPIFKKIKQISKQNNISLIVHLPDYLPINCSSPKIVFSTLKTIKNEINIAKIIGAKIITIHGGDTNYQYSSFQPLINNLRKITNNNITVCLENSSKGLICKPREFLYVLNSINNLKATFDIGHADLLNTDLVNYIKDLNKFIHNVHLHDTDGNVDHKPIGKGRINFQKIIEIFEQIHYKGPFIFEIFSYSDIKRSKEKFLKWWDKLS